MTEQTISEDSLEDNYIHVEGARENNLKNIDVSIPRDKLTVITGLSGSGKSSLAFDTIYAEGQRRYIDTFSSYSRQFLGGMERPDVDKITGLSPVISIEQKTTNKNPRSTVGTTTEIYDFLRLLYARIGEAYSYLSGEKMVKYSSAQIINLIIEKYTGKKAYILAPVVKGRKGHYKELFEQIRKKGFLHARIDGAVQEIKFGHKVDRYKIHEIEIVIDKLIVDIKDEKRIKQSVDIAMKHGHGTIMVIDYETNESRYYSKKLMCPVTGISYNEPAPHSFSFNSPHGACPRCSGLGYVNEIDINKIIPNQSLSIKKGGIKPLGVYKKNLIFCQLEAIIHKYGYTLDTPIEEISEDALNVIMFGSNEMFSMQTAPIGINSNFFLNFEGLLSYLLKINDIDTQIHENGTRYDDMLSHTICPECKGLRLKKESLHFKIDDKNISELAKLDITSLKEWFDNIHTKLNTKEKTIATEVIKEISSRLNFLLDVGLHYLSLDRNSNSLSGGESQRIRLATQIGSQLVNVLYILDEPSIGLHQRDNIQLIEALKKLRDLGNTIIVVEHDKDMMLAADYIIDIGPGAGKHGGIVSAQGIPAEFIKQTSITTDFLKGIQKINIPTKYRDGNGKSLKLFGATGHNLKNVNIDIPLGKFISITGVSGSGKSSLINQTLHPILNKHFYNSLAEPLPYERIEGIENINKVIEVDQSPIGRTPRSNPATYTKMFDEIRKVFEKLPESKIRGYNSGRYSFNIKGGRCEKCKGAGLSIIEMNFLPDVYIRCDECNGKRYNRETLEVRYKGKSISDVLDMTISQAVDFFENIPSIALKAKALNEVGLGYVTLGQASTTLSGGEAQRVKLATELSKKDTGNTLYILDEPTTGLHFYDIKILLNVLNKLVDKGNTVVIIEHNLDVIKSSDWIIDIGSEGGKNGGSIICAGTPLHVMNNKNSYTAQFLKAELENK